MRRPATATWPSSVRDCGQRGGQSATTGARHSSPNEKRSVRKVKGGAYCRPSFVATYPVPHTATKYQARSAEEKGVRSTFPGWEMRRLYGTSPARRSGGGLQRGDTRLDR